MAIAEWINLASTVALVGALMFGALQVRAANRSREEFAALSLIQTVQSEGWVSALTLLQTIPEGASAEDIDRLGPDVARAIQDVGVRIETMGYLVWRGILSLDMVADLFGGVVVFWWSRVQPFVERDRVRTSNPKSYEWFEWLVARLKQPLASGRVAYQRAD